MEEMEVMEGTEETEGIDPVRDEHSRWLRAFTIFTALSTLVLIVVGALVTSTDSGDAVPTWPLSPEGVMPRMVGGVLYEYGHRIVAGIVGLLITIQMVWLLRAEDRAWLRRLGVAAFVAVIAQGLLGALRVLIVSHDTIQNAAVSLTGSHVQSLRIAIAIIHACLAQSVFCSTVVIGYFAGRPVLCAKETHTTTSRPSGLRTLGIVTFIACLAQLLAGAVMRHLGAGLAIPDFPTSFGRAIPPLSHLPFDPQAANAGSYEELRTRVIVHFAHRAGAVLVAALVASYAVSIIRKSRDRRELVSPAILLLLILPAQLLFGALIIWTGKSVLVTAIHVASGALLLATLLIAVLLEFVPERMPAIQSHAAHRPRVMSRFADYMQLAKARITLLVMVSTLMGYLLASDGQIDIWLLIHTLIGSTLVVAATNGLNQVLERDADARMKRTANRPLPAGRIGAFEAVTTLTFSALIGIAYLTFRANLLTGMLALIALLNYLFVYTPLKKKTPLCTAIGAISGSIPPMMGWTAVRGSVDLEAWVLFAILFVWQFPHFLAIGWLYREDYAGAGFRMLPVLDEGGGLTARKIAAYLLALVPISLLPVYIGLAGTGYLVGAIVLNVVLLAAGLGIVLHRSKMHAKRLLMATVLYLPALLILMNAYRIPIR